MKKEKLINYTKMLNSNQDFYMNLDNENYKLDDNILAQIIALYCINNYNDFCERYIHEISKMNYRVDNGQMLVKDERESIDKIIEYFIKREKEKSIKSRKSPIFVNFGNDNVITKKENSSSLINFKEEKKQIKSFKRYELINDLVINDSTSQYIKDVNNDFRYLINNIIIKLLTNKSTTGLEQIHVEFIYGLINFLLNAEYNDEIPINILTIPRNRVSLKRGYYEQKDVVTLEEEVKKLDEEINKQSQRIRYIKTYSEGDTELLKNVAQYAKELQDRKDYVLDKIFQLKFTQENFNRLVVSTISKSIRQKNMEFREEIKDPTITSFTQTNNIIENFIELHLQTFVNLIDNEQLINYYGCAPLYLKYPNKG